MTKKSLLIAVVVVFVFALLTACGGAAAPAEEPAAEEEAAEEEAPAEEEAAEEEAPAEEEAAEEEAPAEEEMAEDDGPVEIRWFIGLGAGAQPEQVPLEEEFVAKFNESHDDIELVMEVVHYDTAYDTFSTQLASGEAADIVGPVGVRALGTYGNAWLDLTDQIDASGYDLSDFNPSLVEFYQDPSYGQTALPFAVYPSVMFYNPALFDEAGLEYPPHEFGAPYADGDPWDWDKVQELAMILTVDANGNDATSPDFDSENVVQWGLEFQWTDPRGEATYIGGANHVYDGEGASVPDEWGQAWTWLYDAIWTDHFVPNEDQRQSDVLVGGQFGSGTVAMAPNNSWFICCGPEDGWDIAAIPTGLDGNITAKLHADTFAIVGATEHPAEAFEVLSYMLGEGAPELLSIYGAQPARASLIATAQEQMAADYPDVDLAVFLEGLNYPDNPNHEAWMPGISEANDRIGAFQTLMRSTSDLDIDAEIDTLESDLQAIFDAAE
jgi:multiple sugar transport system substrate-binding protein